AGHGRDTASRTAPPGSSPAYRAPRPRGAARTEFAAAGPMGYGSRRARRGKLVLRRNIRTFAVVAVLGAWLSTLAPAAAHAAFPGANGRIVFDTAELFFTGTGSSQIYRARHDGSDVRRLTSVPEGTSAWNPRVSADGD